MHTSIQLQDTIQIMKCHRSKSITLYLFFKISKLKIRNNSIRYVYAHLDTATGHDTDNEVP